MKKKYFIIFITLLLLCLAFLFLFLKRLLPAKQPGTIYRPQPSAEIRKTEPPTTKSPEPTRQPKPELTPAVTVEITPEPTEVSAPPTPQAGIPDFEELAKQNPDIYAWIDIPGSGISYAVLQSATDDTIYLDHEEHGWYSANGALFTEHVYNSRDFTDPVTIIYGHHMRSGAMFGNLQTFYSSSSNFMTYSDIYIYMPEQELHYQIFAAVPFDGYHILYAHDFSDAKTFQSFFDAIMETRMLGSNVDTKCELAPEDKIIILSTCLQGNNKNRFLVMAKQISSSS